MSQATNASSVNPVSAGQQTSKMYTRTQVAEARRRVQGALKRVGRLEEELKEVRSILRRRFVEKQAEGENGEKAETRQIRLLAFDVATFRNKRMEIERELTLARRDHLLADREFSKMIKVNLSGNAAKLKAEKAENQLRRQSKSLLKKGLKLIKHEAGNGGAEKVKELVSLAQKGNVGIFRQKFDEYCPVFDDGYHVTVSGVGEVKTEIIHGIMDEMADPNQSFIAFPQ